MVLVFGVVEPPGLAIAMVVLVLAGCVVTVSVLLGFTAPYDGTGVVVIAIEGWVVAGAALAIAGWVVAVGVVTHEGGGVAVGAIAVVIAGCVVAVGAITVAGRVVLVAVAKDGCVDGVITTAGRVVAVGFDATVVNVG